MKQVVQSARSGKLQLKEVPEPVVTDGHLLVLSEIGVLRLIEATPEAYRGVAVADLNRATASIDGSAERPLLRAPAWNAPVLSHGLLYLLGKDTLLALELRPEAEATRPAPVR